MKNNFYYVLTDDSTENILVSKNFNEMFDFLTKNRRSKLSTINHKRKPRILDKRDFLKSYLKNVKDKHRFFELCNLLIKGKNNVRHFVNTEKLLKEYINYQENKNILL